MSNTLSSRLSNEDFINPSLLEQLSSSTYTIDKLGLTSSEKERVLQVYMDGLHYVFIYYAVVVGIAAILSLGVGNTDLQSKSGEASKEANVEASSGTEASDMMESSCDEDARPGTLAKVSTNAKASSHV